MRGQRRPSPLIVIVARHIHVALYDNGVMRPKVAAGALTIAFGATANRLYGYGNEVSDFQFVRWNVDETGIVSGDSIGLVDLPDVRLSLRSAAGADIQESPLWAKSSHRIEA